MIVCLAANPSVDRLFEVERLVKGDIHRPSGFVQVAGGKGLNVARAARSLGADVCAVALLRGHNGRWLQESLAAEGVEGEFVWTHGESRSSLSVADRETAGLTEFYEHGAVAPDAAWVELTHAVTQRWATGQLAHDLGLAPAGRAGRWLPRPDPRGAPRGRPRRARLRGGAAPTGAHGGAGDRQGQRRGGGRAAGRPHGAPGRLARRGVARSARWRVVTGTPGSSRAGPRA